MKLKPLTNGKVSGEGSVTLSLDKGSCFGGVLATADGTNACVIQVRENNSEGAIVFEVSPKQSGQYHAPYSVPETNVLWYSVTGAGASAQLYEWNW